MCAGVWRTRREPLGCCCLSLPFLFPPRLTRHAPVTRHSVTLFTLFLSIIYARNHPSGLITTCLQQQSNIK